VPDPKGFDNRRQARLYKRYKMMAEMLSFMVIDKRVIQVGCAMNFLLGILQYIFAEKVKFDQAI
jgi:hypothetical protein